ncbi:hypothetical protein GPECTOR_32g498 [Gonium pectorale]|uniref:Fibrocystin-L n=1 Tax=Gonium pectorale TaxID=33097 RepID=A0A150GE75_GONPE|nr:hypothetical protein GPECTOR_32g498 [Gonium pectorale]|eukprot:KXZ47885.1 hypothetical protein GPECTOR_32g498 [Gonium pectorale]
MGTAESANVTMSFEGSLRGGQPVVQRSAYRTAADGTPYMFQTYAEVTAVSPSRGSLAGGTLVTISGRGFPTLSLGRNDSVVVTIAGAPCRVVSSTYSQLVCETGPRPVNYQPPRPLKGLYPGMRGIEYEYYTSAAGWISNLWRINDTMKIDMYNGSYKSVLNGAWEIPPNETLNAASFNTKSFFIAPRDGNYTFLLSCDDDCYMNGTYALPNGTVISSTMTALMSAWTGWNDWFKYPFQQTPPVTLTAGQPILLEVAGANILGHGGMAAGVIAPSAVSRFNSVPEVQNIVVTGASRARVVTLKYRWAAGVKFVFNVTVTAPTASILQFGVNALSLANLTYNTSLYTSGLAPFPPSPPPPGSDCTFFNPRSMLERSGGANFGPYRRSLIIPDVSTWTVAAEASPMPAVTPGGSWTLWLADTAGNALSSPVSLTWNAAVANVQTAVNGLFPGKTIAVTGALSALEGGYLSNTWTVTFNIAEGNNVPRLMVTPGTDMATDSASISSSLTQNATTAVAGTFRVAYGPYCESVTIATSDTATEVKNKLTTLPGLAAPLDVQKSGNQYSGFTWKVTFDPQSNSGNQPLLRVSDASNVTGTDVRAYVTELVQGSTRQLYGPIPTEFTALAVASPVELSVVVNNVPSACAHPAGGPGCTFTYDQALTPSVTAVSPNSFNFASGASGLPLTITGTGFAASAQGNEVFLDDNTTCTVTSASATTIVCSLPPTIAAGSRTVRVRVIGVGFASAADASVRIAVRVLAITGVSYPSIAPRGNGAMLLNVSGRGFDSVNCDRNTVSVGGSPCGVLACSWAQLQVLCSGPAITAGVTTATVIVSVSNASSIVVDSTVSPANSTLVVDPAGAPRVSVASALTFPATGGVVNLTVAGMEGWTFKAVWLLPNLNLSALDFSTGSRNLLLSRAFGAAIAACRGSVSYDAPGRISCAVPYILNGVYGVALEPFPAGPSAPPRPWVLAQDALSFDMAITGVWPRVGSIGGGTELVITGSGFAPGNRSGENVVLIPVPVSTTFLNGLVVCDVTSATATQIRCRTRPHLATDADAMDPMARNTLPRPSGPNPGPIRVVSCGSDATLSSRSPAFDINKFYCAFMPTSARAAACRDNGGDMSACSFTYTWDPTPSISSISSSLVFPGDTLTVSGIYLGDVVSLELWTANGTVGGTCLTPFAAKTASQISCVIALNTPAGVYQVVLITAAGGYGGMSVDPNKVGRVAVATRLTAVTGGVGSLGGGGSLILTAAGAGFNASAPSNNKVLVDQLPCNVTAVTSTSLTCTLPAVAGNVKAEFWNYSGSIRAVDFTTYPNPVSNQGWGEPYYQLWPFTSSPDPAFIGVDYFAGRFTFYMPVNATGVYTFAIYGDDNALLYVDGVFLGSGSLSTQSFSTSLTAGMHKFMVVYSEVFSGSTVDMWWDAGDGKGANRRLPWTSATPFPPATPVPLTVTVNGVPAVHDCPNIPLTLAAPDAVAIVPGEATSISVPAPTCAYVFSSYSTAIITATAGVPPPSGVGLPSLITLTGSWLTSDAANISVSVGGQPCTNVTLVPTATAGLSNVTCILPSLPGNLQRTVSVTVAGRGAARLAPTVGVYSLTMRFPLAITSIVPNRISHGGGVEVVVNGYGFVPPLGPLNASKSGRFMSVSFTDNNMQPGNLSTPLSLGALIVSVTTTQLRLRIPRLYSSFSPSVELTKVVQIVLTDFGTGYNYQASSAGLYFNHQQTPTPLRFSPATASATASTTFNVSWSLRPGIVLTPTPAGQPSRASVSLTPIPPTFPAALNYSQPFIDCTAPTVMTAAWASSTYNETLNCTLPAGTPSNVYAVWVCVTNGCRPMPGSVTVPLELSSVSPQRGSYAGGDIVTITGSGFASNTSAVTVFFGNASCAVLQASFTSVTCQLGSALGNDTVLPTSEVVGRLQISPSEGAPLQTFADAALAYTFDPAMTPVVRSALVTRGSTEGGTNLTYIIAFGSSGVPASEAVTITIANLTCLNVTVSVSTGAAGSAAVSCFTPKPPLWPTPPGPLPVRIAVAGRGFAHGNLSYEYVNLWSRRTTWGGGPLPVEESLIYIPSNTSIVLDVSPPLLSGLIVEGILRFDEAATAELELRVKYIIIRGGGQLFVGNETVPYSGRAKITLVTQPHVDLEIPLYGSKVIAVRDGKVVLHGQHKEPTWTRLAATAGVGAESILLTGRVNWRPGDVIAIASSSFYTNQSETATIVAANYDPGLDVTMVDLNAKLNFTHLGVIEPIAYGQANGATIDMRAEVAVLTRNVVLQGDENSEAFMFGATVMVSTPSGRPRANLRFEQAEIRQTGQAFRLGRYTMHFHMHGDLAYQSWIRGCAVHHTYNRALTIHGSHRVIVQDNVAYNVMGHAFFLEDGIETGNIFENNLGMSTRASSALLNTDTTPATFWITNPNNTYRNNVAAGSDAYGYWVRLLDNPEGPSYTTSVCPKFTPLGVIQNNVAHSNMFYGFRIHPEYYPKQNPCSNFMSSYIQVPAVIDGLTTYKNGMKGAIATQVGLVIFANLTAADNGGGPLQHVVNGKDTGGGFEMTWIVDDRNRADVPLASMAGLRNAVIVSRTVSGFTGTAGAWPSDRRVNAIISQSAPMGHLKHSALMSVINVTFVDWTGSRYTALEACGKCKTFQGGGTTFTSRLSFIQSSGGSPALSHWTWGHQGVYLDTDGSLVNAANLPPELSESLPWPVGTSGATWHSAVESELFNPVECTYVRGVRTSNNGAFCSPDLIFRRIMLNQHTPAAIMYRDLLVTSVATNRTSIVHFTNYNEQGYQFTAATRRDYWLHWDTDARVDPDFYRLHKMDPMNASLGWVHLSTQYLLRLDRVEVNGVTTSGGYASLPPPTAPHGSSYYNKSFSPNSWWWGNFTYNDTKFSVFVKGDSNAELRLQAQVCPIGGCGLGFDNTTDLRGTLFWSDTNTWLNRPGGKPKAGENVTVPFGWNLVIDENTAPLADLVVLGNITFSPTGSSVLTANNVFVAAGGRFYAGSRAAPFPVTGKATIRLTGGRQDSSRAVDSSLVLGSKFIAAFRGGIIDLHGQSVGSRWTRLGASAPAGSSAIALASPQTGWAVGSTILITSSDYNVWHAEERTIVAVQNNGATLLLDSPLSYPHYAWTKSYANVSAAASSPPLVSVDMRAEVALLSSNIVIEAAEGPGVDALGGEYYGCRVLAHGASVARLSNVALRYCGQAGLDVPAVLFDRLASVPSGPSDPPGGVPNPSFLIDSVVYRSMDFSITGNVMYFSYDKDTVIISTPGNTIQNNLALGTLKNMDGNSGFDIRLPATFLVNEPDNYIANNVAAGSERIGFYLYGPPCSSVNNGFNGTGLINLNGLGSYGGGNASAFRGYFLNNTAHSNLVGLILKPSAASIEDGCTAVRNFTSYTSWDFDVLPVKGISTNVFLKDFNSINPKHAGVLILKTGELTEDALVTMADGVVAGRTHPEVCSMCAVRADPGCHPKLSTKSYNKYDPFTPAVGLLSSSFAIEFTKGPETKPWDAAHGYQTVLGRMHIYGTTFADWQGAFSCGGPQGWGQAAYAIGNHAKMPDAFHPHYFSRSNVINVLNNGSSTGMFLLQGPDPKWRNEADCGFQTFKQPDGSILELNCAGPKHVHFRDLDGTLTGTRSTVVGTYDTRRTFPYDQGTPIIPGPCTYAGNASAYTCLPNSSAYGLPDVSMKPVPTPVGGIGGNQHLFVLESRDGDSEDRNFGPVMFNVSGSIDLVVAAMDQGWCFAYTCQKRLSTFWTYLPMGHTVGVNFTGTPATVFRLWLPYAAPEDELVLEIYYMLLPNRRFVWLPESGRVAPSATKPRPGDGTPHGTFYWDQNTTTITVKIKGGRNLEIRGENAVLVGWGLAMSVNDFYDNQALFVSNLANFLGIPPERVFIARVVPGTERRRQLWSGASWRPWGFLGLEGPEGLGRRGLNTGASSTAQIDVMIYDDPAKSNNQV